MRGGLAEAVSAQAGGLRMRRENAIRTIAELEDACPAVGRDTIRFVLTGTRDAGQVECLGKGRWAKWRRIE